MSKLVSPEDVDLSHERALVDRDEKKLVDARKAFYENGERSVLWVPGLKKASILTYFLKMS